MTDQIGSWHGPGNAPGSEEEPGFAGWVPTDVRGKLTRNAPLDKLVWFKSGGPADWLFEPADLDDLVAFLSALEEGTPVMALGLGSNLIVRDGGVPGVVIRLGKPFSTVEVRRDCVLECGGGASGILVSSTARDAGIAGLEFLRGIPGTVGGFVRMNGGAYGREVADILVDCDVVLPDGNLITLLAADLNYSYRHSDLPEGAIVVAARFKGVPGDPKEIGAEMDRIAAAREESQPLRSRTCSPGASPSTTLPSRLWPRPAMRPCPRCTYRRRIRPSTTSCSPQEVSRDSEACHSSGGRAHRGATRLVQAAHPRSANRPASRAGGS